MVVCSACGKHLEKVPDWLQGVQVEFICNNCPNRKLKNIAFVQLPAEAPAKDKTAAPDELEAVEDEEES